MIGHELPRAVQVPRCWVGRIPRDRVEEQITVVGRCLVQVDHFLDVPRLRQSQRGSELAIWQLRRNLPIGKRRSSL